MTSSEQQGEGPNAHSRLRGDFLSPLQLATLLLQYRRRLLTWPAACFVFVVLAIVLPPRSYTATVAFTANPSASSLGQLSGLAAQIGVSLPGQSPEDSPLFYGDLVRTNQFLRDLALTIYRFPDADSTIEGNIISLSEISESTREKSLHEAIRLLREEMLLVSPDRQTGIVTIRAKSRWPHLSEAMARRSLELINTFNEGSRQSNASATRDFLTARVDTAAVELRLAEDKLQSFLISNREYRSDPRLAFEYDRLSRAVTLRQTIYSTLVEGREQARLEAVRNTPSISIVEPPATPLRPDRRGLVIKSMLSLIVGFCAALASIVLLESFRHSATQETQADMFRRALAAARRDPLAMRRRSVE